MGYYAEIYKQVLSTRGVQYVNAGSAVAQWLSA